MSRIMDTWDDTLRQAISTDPDERENAIFCIGLILERHTRPDDRGEFIYIRNLPRPLQRLTLDEKRQRDTVIYLAALVQNKPDSAASYMYALGRAKPSLAAAPLLDVLHSTGGKLKHDAAYEAVRIIAHWRKHNATEALGLLAMRPIAGLLAKWATSGDADLSVAAARLRDQLYPPPPPAPNTEG